MNLFHLLISSWVTLQWQLIESAFYQTTITQNQNWKSYGSGDDPEQKDTQFQKCHNNPQFYILSNCEIRRIKKQFSIAHYQLRLIATVFFFDNDDSSNTDFSIRVGRENYKTFYSTEYDSGNSTFQYVSKICSLDASSVKYYYQTIQNTVDNDDYQFTISSYFSPHSNNKIGIRDIFIYANICHFSCQECKGPNANDCTNCYSGNLDNGRCQCKSNQNTFLMKVKGCIAECPNTSYLSDINQYCQPNLAVSSLLQAFTQDSFSANGNDWQQLSDLNGQSLSSNIYQCKQNSKTYNLVGVFSGSVGMKYMFSNIPALVAVRLRITFTFFSFAENSSLLIYLDDILQASVNRTKTSYKNQSCVLTQVFSGQCDGKPTYLARYEILLKTYDTNPVLRIFGTSLAESEKWGFHNITIDKIVCTTNCAECLDNVACKQCIGGMYLHKGQCTAICPPYSTQDALKCIDFDEEIKYQKYLVKAFFDFNTTMEDIQTYIGSQNWQSKTGQYFSYFSDKMVLGGPMVWYDNQFITTFTVGPHYKYSLRMKVVLGDNFSGAFNYQITPGSPIQVLASGTNCMTSFIGDCDDEYVITIPVQLVSHVDTSLTITLDCNSIQGISNGFCAIYDYSLVIHYCHPLCATSCTGPELIDCTPNPTNCLSNYYYSQTSSRYQCKICPSECSMCTSETFCTVCDSTKGLFDLIRGECICQSQIQIKVDGQCKACHQSCTTCFGVNEYNCLSCDLKRKLHAFQCECDNRYFQDEMENCQPICGDGLVVDGEQCDDGNYIAFDGCFDCQLQCQPQCTQCTEGICQQCTQYWQLSNNSHLCEPICGDGYAVEGLEECDDGNYIDEDGCFQCYFKCQKQCTLCHEGKCYECNILGWILNNNSICEPFCGDGLVIEKEQCDDMNDIQNDGCYQCHYQCDEYCQTCTSGICYDCVVGRYVSNNSCVSLCGDGLLVEETEVCDDGNIDNLDGCDMYCHVEADWYCYSSPKEPSVCIYQRPPEFSITLLTKEPEDFEIVDITFSQPIKSNVEIEKIGDLMSFTIENLESTDYQISFKFINEPQQDITQEIQINLQINYFIPCEYPQLRVSFDQDLFKSEYGINLLENSKSKTLQTPMVLSMTQKVIAQSAGKFNTAVIYSLVGVSSFCLITGSLGIFWNLMDQLQYLSYLKYVNVQFPNNLNIFFQAFNLISLSPIIQFIGLDKLFNIIDGPSEYSIDPADKFLKDDINAYFLSNFQSSIFCIATAFLSLIFAYMGRIIINKNIVAFSNKLGYRLTKLLMSGEKICEKIISQFYYNGLLRLVMSNCYDCSFAAYIQMASQQVNLQDDIILQANYFSAVFVALGQLVLTLVFINIMHSFAAANTIKKQKKFDSIFEGVKPNKDFWITQFNSVYFLKKQIFIFFIVFFQQNGVIQALGIGINQFIFTSYIFLNKPLQNNYEYYKMLVTESLIVIASTTFVIYALRVALSITLDNNIILGWLHIGVFSFILAFSLIIDIVQQIQALFLKLKCSKKPQPTQVNSQELFY